MSLIAPINLNCVITQLPILGAVDGITFEAISQKIVPKLWQGACVILNNCKIYLGEDVEAMIKAAGARLIYLPPYSPDFFPIETCWSKIKAQLRAIGARTYSDLEKAVDKAFESVSLEDLLGWFTHFCYCTSSD